MYSKRIISVLVLFSLVLSVSATAAESTDAPQIAGKPADVKYPFIATVTANDVYVRSGKGTAYYHCGKINMGDKVTVVEESLGWAKVVPPAGSYAWIHKDYVDVKSDNATVGVLKGNNVRVWAGSDYIEPTRSSSTVARLNQGEIVELLPDQPQTGDYYKIKSPSNAFLWVSSEFLKYLGPVQSTKPIVVPTPPSVTEISNLPPSNETETPMFTNLDPNATVPSVSTDTMVEQESVPGTGNTQTPPVPAEQSEALKQCYALATKIDQEVQKPLEIQNYSDIRKTLETIQANPTDAKAATYAQILLERIQRYELAISIVKTLKEQDEALAKTKEQIDKAHQTKLENLPKETGFIYAGVLKESHVYTEKKGQKRYLIQGPDGKILCYVTTASNVVGSQLDGLLGKKVGIRGTVSKDQNSLVTLVSATSVESLQ